MRLPIPKVGRRLVQRARKLREDLHMHPELSLEEKRTCAVVAERLRKAGLDQVHAGVGGTGVVALLRGERPGPTVALRADIDALPIQEASGVPHASKNDGVMHACGHDGHTAILVAVAELLSRARGELSGNVKFIFQPGEEGYGGARLMLDAGCLSDPQVDGIFALHGANKVAPGRIEVTPTPYAAMASFRLEVLGRGGHGAYPDTCIDPIAIGSHIVTAAQTIVSRESGPAEPVVLSFCAFQAGTAANVIPDSAVLLGTLRAMELSVLRRVRRSLWRVARSVATGMRGKVTIEDLACYPPVKNDPELLELVRQVGCALLGRRNVGQARNQVMGSEDFSYYLPEQGGVPGAMFRLGIETTANHHTPRFDFGSAALEPGILMMANVAALFLERKAESTSS